MLDNLNLERPYFGYFSEVKVHHTERPRPEGIKKPELIGKQFNTLPISLSFLFIFSLKNNSIKNDCLLVRTHNESCPD
jgi:hypothetical protein